MAGETDDFNDILNGTTFAVDSTGRSWDVPAGNGGKLWMNGQQTVVNSAFQPGPGFTALTAISH